MPEIRYPRSVIHPFRNSHLRDVLVLVAKVGLFGALTLLTLAVIACKKEEQAVVGVAHTAQQAQQKAQAAATERERQRAALATIPLPSKSQYINVHEPAPLANPF